MKAEDRERTAESWSYVAGEKGRNRVRLYERGDRLGIWIDYRDADGQRVRQPLGYADREVAKLKADEVAAQFRRLEVAPAAAITLLRLFEIYEREVTPQKSATTQAHDRRTLPLFLRAFGGQRRPGTLNRRDWDSYIQRRRRGELALEGREGKPVRPRVLEQDCNLLNAVLNWAVRAGDGTGGYLLERNPLAGLPVPRDESPRRAVLTREQFEAACIAAAAIAPQLYVFAVLAWYTGHRSKSIRLLRWADVDLEGARIHWRGENDKIGHDHWNPLHPEAVVALRAERARVGTIDGDAWIFPASRPTGTKAPWSEHAVVNLWKRIAVRAKIPPHERYGWHSFRRAFANSLRDVALRDLKDLGGWKSTATVVNVYQQPSERAQRSALASLHAAPTGDSEAQWAPATGTSDRSGAK